MPLPFLDPFPNYHHHFHIGGEPWAIEGISDSWREFSEAVAYVASGMRSSDDCEFVGSEADAFHLRLYQFGPNRIDTVEEAHIGLADALVSYAGFLQTALTEMDALVAIAVTDHAAVDAAVLEYNTTEATLHIAIATASPTIAVLEAKLAKDHLAYELALNRWKDDLMEAVSIKERLGNNVDSVVAVIAGLADPVSYSGAPDPGAISSYVHLHIGRLEALGQQLQSFSEKIAAEVGLLKSVEGEDDVHGYKISSAVENFKGDWAPSLDDLIAFVRRLGEAGVEIARLYQALDIESAEKFERVNQYIRSLDWYLLDDDDLEAAGLIASNWLNPTLIEKETAPYFNAYGVDYLSWNDDLVHRGANGEVLLVEKSSMHALGEVTRGHGGAWYVVSKDRETVYYPVAPPNTVKENQLLSKHKDMKTGMVTKEFIRPDGSVFTQKMPASQVGNTGNVYKQNLGVTAPAEQVPNVQHIYREDGTETTVVYHNDTHTADVINHDGSPAMHVNPYNDKILHLGTKDAPIEGPVQGIYYDIVVNDVGMKPSYSTYEPTPLGDIPDINSKNITFVTGRIGDLGAGIQIETTPEKEFLIQKTGIGMPTGQHHLPSTGLPISFDDAQKISKVASKIGTAGNIYTFGEGLIISAHTQDAMPLINAGGAIAGGWAGAKVGVTAGTFIYPGPGTIIGALAGGLGGGFIGEKAAKEGGEFVIEKITDN